MSFDRLQSLIKTTKCPFAAEIVPAGGERAEAFASFAGALMDALRGTVPALRFSLGSCAGLGWRGVKALEELLALARERGFYTLLDAPGCEDPALLSAFPADCLVVGGYLGSERLVPLLEGSRDGDRSLFLLAHTAGPGAGELQELVAGDRLVYQVVGDLAQRLGKNDLGQLGYSRLGIVAQGVYPSDLRALRKRWEQSFLLASGPAEDVRFAFDRYGRGAIVSTPDPLGAAREQGEDLSAAGAAAQSRAAALRDELKQYITIL